MELWIPACAGMTNENILAGMTEKIKGMIKDLTFVIIIHNL